MTGARSSSRHREHWCSLSSSPSLCLPLSLTLSTEGGEEEEGEEEVETEEEEGEGEEGSRAEGAEE